MPAEAAKKIVIVGGGTAGWMAANLMVKCWGALGFAITLVESPDIGIIGVGEGSTPQLQTFFNFIGVQEREWMPRCNATYKNGIRFKHWSTIPGFEAYTHPFMSEVDFRSSPLFFRHCALRRQGIDVEAHPDSYYLATLLANEGLGPKPNDNFPFIVDYGYHFDSHLLGQFLRDLAVSRGVVHRHAKVSEVQLDAQGHISSLHLDTLEVLQGDLYVDCSGFRSLLLQQALGVGFRTFKENLFNDAAVTLPTPQGDTYAAQTTSTAMRYGWAWQIPLQNRNGNGYVYSSDYCSADQAETELRAALGALDADVEARHLKMRVGQVEKHWHKNCLAVGLSQGFIEPLEATALHLVQETVQNFIGVWEKSNFSSQRQDEFNRYIDKRFEGVRDYIVCHYACNTRQDTQYWLDNAENTCHSDTLQAMLTCWLSGGDVVKEIERLGIGQYYPAMSWHALLAGYGIFRHPQAKPATPAEAMAARSALAKLREFNTRCAKNFQSHTDQLRGVVPDRQHPSGFDQPG